MQHPMQSKTDLYCYRFFTPTNRAMRPKRLLMEKVFLQLQQQQLLSPSPPLPLSLKSRVESMEFSSTLRGDGEIQSHKDPLSSPR